MKKSNKYQFIHPGESNYEPLSSIGNPDWKKPSDYIVNPEQDFFSCMAWELLRRNRYFQKFCDDYVSTDLYDWDMAPKFLDKWGIAEFKHYKENFIGENSPAPLWLLPQPAQIIPNVYKEWPLKLRRAKFNKKKLFADHERSLSIGPGQVAVVFDLKEVAQFKSLLASQLKAARIKLDEYLNQLRGDLGIVDQESGVQKDQLIPSLRLADALFSNRQLPRVKLAEVLFPEVVVEAKENCWGNMEIQNRMYPHIKRAADLIYERGYLALPTKDSAHRSDKIPKK